ncbi:MAG: hypothetical protein QME94_11260 [Anaerolineae bacterium]|nr:hypothetical protein [Anaerolineae bacterium]
MGPAFIAIEHVRRRDWILGHDGQPHRVLRTLRGEYRGAMVGIRHAFSPRVLWLTGEHRALCLRRTVSYGAERTWRHVPPEHFARSRDLRRRLTPAERRL